MTAFATENKFYKGFILTEEGRTRLRESINIKRQWKEGQGDISVGTYGVKLKIMNDVLRSKIQKIKITPIGLNNQCHRNSTLFTQNCGYTSQLGFNVTACPCGRKICLEIHSVNEKNGVLYDFTKDFNDETDKYFLPLKTEATANKFIAIYGKLPYSINRGCRCNINWIENDEVTKITQGDFIDLCKDIEDNLDGIKVYC